jgi:hypothetical protein
MCGKGFDQKSRLERHVETSHPKPAPSAADLEKASQDCLSVIENAKVESRVYLA